MFKLSIFISVSIIILIYFNYPFQSEGISYAIVLTCSIIIVFSGIKLWTDKNLPNEDYDSYEKKLNKTRDENGIFSYSEDGFSFTIKKQRYCIKYSEIVAVNSFSIPSGYRTSDSGLEIITENESFEFETKTIIGLEKLADKLCDNLPNWKMDAEFSDINNFGLKKSNIFERRKKSGKLNFKN